MARIDTNVKSIRYPVPCDEKLTLLARKLKRTKRQLFIEMVDYFYRSKKDPADMNDEMLKSDLSRIGNRLVGFFRTQESELLVPIHGMAQELVGNTETVKDELKSIHEKQGDAEKLLRENTKHASEQIRLLTSIFDGLAKMEEMRAGFRRIMEGYIAEREALGWSTSSGKKDELVRRFRLKVDRL
ncbi:BfmA/BtgA family mobilization protein [Sphingobacterium oryzagri]|uniref:BfmA/BtgA family mobilization protein n=1 Tax=Sphingobacterium oryzagri TaxID=3025669 RepID=A0ABY7WLK8_9SPHI|nr:BfmA/BtgA family mobilization protein [Sphingobacterium sp. KACC 22765]WDF69205.1 BfmA/BtgA family mobilization protein [Sphingobacterium sp. KACC 22765]